jgi:hypothetical protein
MRQFPLSKREFFLLRRANTRYFAGWVLTMTSIILALDGTKHFIPSPQNLPILAALHNDVPMWPRWMGRVSAIVLDALFMVVVHGVTRSLAVLNRELEDTLPPTDLPLVGRSGESTRRDGRFANPLHDIFGPTSPQVRSASSY